MCGCHGDGKGLEDGPFQARNPSPPPFASLGILMKRLRFKPTSAFDPPKVVDVAVGPLRGQYRYGAIALHGALYKREETGPFPVVIYDHGSVASMLSEEATRSRTRLEYLSESYIAAQTYALDGSVFARSACSPDRVALAR